MSAKFLLGLQGVAEAAYGPNVRIMWGKLCSSRRDVQPASDRLASRRPRGGATVPRRSAVLRSASKRPPRLLLAGLALVGAQRLYSAAYRRAVRWHIERIERDVPYDDDLKYCLDRGEPIFLVRPENDRTLFFVDGFRIRPAVGMNAEWLRNLHEEHGINIVAPIIGIQSRPFRLRGLPWSFHMDMREAVQLYDVYAESMGPGHRIATASFSFGSISSLAIAARRRPWKVILISPAPAVMRAPRDVTRRMRQPWGKMIEFIVDHALNPNSRFRLERMSWLEGVIPYYVRPGVSGGWDVANRELREEVNRTILNGQELRIGDVFELLRGFDWAGRRLVPQIHSSDITIISGAKDMLIMPDLIGELRDRLRAAGNSVRWFRMPNSAHNLLLDRDSDTAKQLILDTLRPERRAAAAPTAFAEVSG